MSDGMLFACVTVLACKRIRALQVRGMWRHHINLCHINNSFRGSMKKIFALMIAALVLAGCNTVQGVGKDVKKVGEAVENVGKK